MNTQSPDAQLEYELQDLYISSRHWLSDISFVVDETRIFHELIDGYRQPDKHNIAGARLHHCKMMLYQQQNESISLKIRVIAYLSFLGPYIADQQRKIGMDHIEKHTTIEKDMVALLEAAKLLKKELQPFANNRVM